jgi:hypothetical protein
MLLLLPRRLPVRRGPQGPPVRRWAQVSTEVRSIPRAGDSDKSSFKLNFEPHWQAQAAGGLGPARPAAPPAAVAPDRARATATVRKSRRATTVTLLA